MRQLKDGWCGPASLQYALKEQGISVSQKKIASVTKTTVKAGVDPKHLARGAKKFGAKTKTVVNKNPQSTLVQLNRAVRSGKSVIVDYLAGNNPKLHSDGHYSVLKGISRDKVRLFDPSPGRVKTINRSTFIKNWKDVTKANKKFKSYGLIISK